MGLIQRIKDFVFVPPELRQPTIYTEFNTKFSVLKFGAKNSVNYYHDSTIYSIIKAVSQIASKAEFGIYKVKDKKLHKRYLSLLEEKNYRAYEVKKAKENGLEAVSITDSRFGDIQLLLENPNKNLNQSEMILNSVSYRMLTGNNYIHCSYDDKLKPFMLSVLPSQYTSIVIDSVNYPFNIVGYDLKTAGINLELDKSEVIHTKYFNPYFNLDGSHLYGLSPLEAIWIELQQNKESRNAGLGLLQNRGVRKIIAFENDGIQTGDMMENQANRLDEAIKNKYKSNKDGVATLFGRVQSVDLGLTSNDLQIIDTIKANKVEIANVFNYPAGLLSTENSTYNNVENWQKQVILNCVLPELIALKEALNHAFNEYWGGKNSGYVIDFDSTIYTELETDRKLLMEWLDNAPFTENEKRVYLGEQPLPEPLMDKVYISSSKQRIDSNGIQE